MSDYISEDLHKLIYEVQNLDTQYTVGIASGVPITFISVGNNNRDGLNGFLDMADTLIGENNAPQVLSTSYGFDEPELPNSLAKSVSALRHCENA